MIKSPTRILGAAIVALTTFACGQHVPTVASDIASAADIPVVGDWNGDGRLKCGLFRNGLWILDYNGDGVIDSNDKTFQYTATAGDVPIVGDWNGDGKTKTGIFRSGQWILDYNGDGKIDYANLGPDKVFQYTNTQGDLPLTGDWSGNHRTKTGVFRSGQVILDYDGDGVVRYGNLGLDRVFSLRPSPK